MFDLHCHSNKSDGRLSPEEIVKRASSIGIKTLALTDHDTISGLRGAEAEAQKYNIKLVYGIEASCVWEGATIHILGYNFAVDSDILVAELDYIKKARWERSYEIDKLLASVGIKDSLSGAVAVKISAGGDIGDPPARPHFALWLADNNYVKNYNAAFNKYLGNNKLGDVKKQWRSMTHIINVLKLANSIISLAHPYKYKMTHTKRKRLLDEFRKLGGHAIEIANGNMNQTEVKNLSLYALQHKMLVSAGSDFHAPSNWSELGSFATIDKNLPLIFHDN